MLIRVESCRDRDLRKRFRYLLEERAPGQPRDPNLCFVLDRDAPEEAFVQAVRNFPENRKVTYWSVVVSFAPEDQEKVLQHLQEIAEDLKRELFRGYPPEDRPFLHAVVHLDEAHPHLHLTILNSTTGTGKAPRWWYYRRDMAWLNAVQRYIRHKYGLANPRDPERLRTLREDRSRAHREAIERLKRKAEAGDPEARRKWKLHRIREKYRRELHRICEEAYLSGFATNREELIAYLEQDLGLEITRRGKDYVTVALRTEEGQAIKVRLRGSIYHEDFRIEDAGEGPERGDSPSLEDLERAIQEAGRARFADFSRRFGPRKKARRGASSRRRARVFGRTHGRDHIRPSARKASGVAPGGAGGARSSGGRMGASARTAKPPMIFPLDPWRRLRRLWFASWERLLVGWIIPFRPLVLLPGAGWVPLAPAIMPRVRAAVETGYVPIEVAGQKFNLADLVQVREAAIRLLESARRKPAPQPSASPKPEREAPPTLARLIEEEAKAVREQEARAEEAAQTEEVSREPSPGRGYIPSPGG